MKPLVQEAFSRTGIAENGSSRRPYFSGRRILTGSSAFFFRHDMPKPKQNHHKPFMNKTLQCLSGAAFNSFWSVIRIDAFSESQYVSVTHDERVETTQTSLMCYQTNRPRKQLESSAPLGFVASGTYTRTPLSVRRGFLFDVARCPKTVAQYTRRLTGSLFLADSHTRQPATPKTT